MFCWHVYMDIWVSMYVYIYANICMYDYVCTVCGYMYIRMCLCKYTYIYVCVSVCVRARTSVSFLLVPTLLECLAPPCASAASSHSIEPTSSLP